MKEINDLNVFLNFGPQRHLVGRLRFLKNENRAAFEYDSIFIAKNFPVSPVQLPLEKKVFRAPIWSGPGDPQHGLHGIFADSLPDSWGLRVQNEYFKKITILDPSPFDRLAFIGKNGLGALEYEPGIESHEAGQAIIELSEMRKSAIGIISGTAAEVSNGLFKQGGSAGGMRPKFVLLYNPSDNKFHYGVRSENNNQLIPCILKIPVKDTEDYQRIEFVYSLIAKKANISITDTKLFEYDNQAYFYIKRFDINDDYSKNHVHTLAGIMGVNFSVHMFDYRDALKLTWGLTKDKRDVEELYRRMAFNVLAKNLDDHAKNFSFLMNSKGQWHLSPAYDMTYSLSRNGVHQMSLNGKTHGHKRDDFKKLADELNIRNWSTIIEEVKDALSLWKSLAVEYGISKDRIVSLQEYFDENRKKL
jgi:serine/threonine-protein kinase HipA